MKCYFPSHDHTLYETLLKVHYRRILAWNYWYYYSHTKSHFNQFFFLTSGTAAPSRPVSTNSCILSYCFWLSAPGRRRAKRENKCGVTVPSAQKQRCGYTSLCHQPAYQCELAPVWQGVTWH